MNKSSLQLLEHVQNVLEEYDTAITLRQLYYQLVARQVIPNLQKYYEKLSRLCVIGRDEGLLPEEAFADRLRQVDKRPSYLDLNDYMDVVREAYTKDKWADQDVYVEVWTEKDALRGVIKPITDYYDVGLVVVRGQVSRTAIYQAYQRFEKKDEEGKKCKLFYFGDFDPSGVAIFNSLKERLENFGEYGGDFISFIRMALTPQQIAEYKLPSDPGKESDPNHKRFVATYGDNVVELDALPPDVLCDLVELAITLRMDREKFGHAQKVEAEERQRLQDLSFSDTGKGGERE